MLVYFPVWVDVRFILIFIFYLYLYNKLFGMGKKTIWLTLLHLGVPLGIFVGYTLSELLPTNLGVKHKKKYNNLYLKTKKKKKYKWAFYIQCILLCSSLLTFIIIDS